MREVKARRSRLDWSAERLAEEMTAAGVPWTRDIVVNLENGRRKSIAVHEVTTLAYVLGAETPLELLAPGLPSDSLAVTPKVRIAPPVAKAWFRGEIGSLRDRMESLDPAEAELIAKMLKIFRPDAPELSESGLSGAEIDAIAEWLAKMSAFVGYHRAVDLLLMEPAQRMAELSAAELSDEVDANGSL
jgi:hypothetical protein